MPVLVTCLALLVLNSATLLKLYYTPVDILRWMGLTALFDTLTFSIAVFVGMFTGNTVAQIVFTYILQLLPSGLTLLLSENLRYLIFGYAVINQPGSFRYDFPLILLVSGTGRGHVTAGAATVYLLATVLFLAAALFTYRLQPAEAAGEVIAFPVLRPVFKYGVTACTMLLAGGYFAAAYRSTFSVITLGYVLGSLVGYLTAEALLQKSLKIWSSYRGYLGYAAIVAALLLGVATDATGYVHRVPDPAKVKEVYYGSYGAYINYLTQVKKNESTVFEDASYNGGCFFKDRDTIEKIVILHRQLLKSPRPKAGTEHYIVYTLENGAHLTRRYSFDEKEYASLLKPIYESLEYKQARFPVVNQTFDNIKMIELGDTRLPKRPVILADRVEIGDFADLLRQDILSATFEELIAGPEDYLYADIVDTTGRYVHYIIRPSYRSAISWLKEKGYYEQIALLPEDVEYAVRGYLRPSKAPDSGTVPKQFEIRDRRLIEELLNASSLDHSTAQGDTIDVTFYIKTAGFSSQYHSSFRRDLPVSKELREYLERLD